MPPRFGQPLFQLTAPSLDASSAAIPKTGEGDTKPSITPEELKSLRDQASELTALRAKAATLENNWNDAQVLMKGDQSPDVVERSFRRAMSAAGVPADQIQAQLDAMKEGDEAPPTGKKASRQDADPDPNDEGTESERRLEELERQQGETAAKQAQARKTQLETIVRESVTASVDLNKDLTTMVNRLASLTETGEGASADEAAKIRKAIIKEEVREKTLDNLRIRRANQGPNAWEDSWIAEEATKAATQVFKKYRAVIGDPAKIGRATETDTGDMLRGRPAIKPPEHKSGMDMGTTSTEVRKWATDSLLRGSTSGENKLNS